MRRMVFLGYVLGILVDRLCSVEPCSDGFLCWADDSWSTVLPGLHMPWSGGCGRARAIHGCDADLVDGVMELRDLELTGTALCLILGEQDPGNGGKATRSEDHPRPGAMERFAGGMVTTAHLVFGPDNEWG